MAALGARSIRKLGANQKQFRRGLRLQGVWRGCRDFGQGWTRTRRKGL